MFIRHVGNLSGNTKGTVGAQLGQKAQYGHCMAMFSKGTVWAQSGHSLGTNE